MKIIKIVKKQPMFDVQRLAEYISANEAYVQREYPGENFISSTEQLQAINKRTKKMVLPENVRVAQSRANIKSNEQQRTLRKELRQSGILTYYGNSVFLTPEYNIYKQKVTDAVINGVPYEFRNVTGSIKKIEERFGEAKKKGDSVNVFLHIETNVSMHEVRRKIGLVLGRHPEYTGKIIVSIRKGNPCYWNTSSFR